MSSFPLVCDWIDASCWSCQCRQAERRTRVTSVSSQTASKTSYVRKNADTDRRHATLPCPLPTQGHLVPMPNSRWPLRAIEIRSGLSPGHASEPAAPVAPRRFRSVVRTTSLRSNGFAGTSQAPRLRASAHKYSPASLGVTIKDGGFGRCLILSSRSTQVVPGIRSRSQRTTAMSYRKKSGAAGEVVR